MTIHGVRARPATRSERVGACASASALACLAIAVALLVDTVRVDAVDATGKEAVTIDHDPRQPRGLAGTTRDPIDRIFIWHGFRSTRNLAVSERGTLAPAGAGDEMTAAGHGRTPASADNLPATSHADDEAHGTIRLAPDTERAWRAYVAATERRIAAELAASDRRFFAHDFAPDAQRRDEPIHGDQCRVEQDRDTRKRDGPDRRGENRDGQKRDGQNRDGRSGRSDSGPGRDALGGERRSHQPPAAASERARALAGDVPLVQMRSRDAAGRLLDVPDALVSHWRGTILLPGVTLDQLWTRLQHPSERGPFPPDVLALRILARERDALTLFIKMTRTKLVTVTYDTEHRVTFHRDAARPTRAWSRSEATRIAEVTRTDSGAERELSADEEHGFLWRLHAYWRYEQVPAGVLVELESLTLSRNIPFGLGAIVGPMVDRIARESMTRTLVGIRTQYAAPRASAPQGRLREAACDRRSVQRAANANRS